MKKTVLRITLFTAMFCMLVALLCVPELFNPSAKALSPSYPHHEIKFEFNEATGELRFYGNGDMDDYKTDTYDRSPWNEYRNSVISVVIEEGITSVGNNAFSRFTTLALRLKKTLNLTCSKLSRNMTMTLVSLQR